MYNSNLIKLHPAIQDALVSYRNRRRFNADLYLKAKTRLLKEYFIQSGITSCVIGISGGIDSAVTLGILNTIFRSAETPLQKIIPVSMPLYVEGATNQDASVARGRDVMAAYELEGALIDLAACHQAMRQCVEPIIDISGNAWAAGQLVSNIRTPALYHIATLLTQEGKPCVVCGTTNRDEGSYIGFVGKASDGMVDLQLISDLHKSEVYALGKYLHVPASVLMADPTGDVFDGKTHAEMLGVSYDFIELYIDYLNLSAEKQSYYFNSWPHAAKEQFTLLATLVEQRHHINAHKYLSGSQSIHFDVYERAVNMGWRDLKFPTLKNKNSASFVGLFALDDTLLDLFNTHPPISVQPPLHDFGDSVIMINQLLSMQEADHLCSEVKKQQHVPAGINGYAHPFNALTDKIGSYRASVYNEKLADILWQRIAPHIPILRQFDEYASTDHQQHKVWRAVGINPLFRFIIYPPEGTLIPHYDAGYDFQDGHQHTLMSVILYLTDSTAEQGGVLRFINDKQRYLPTHERNFSDHSIAAKEQDVLAAILPAKGHALIMDHRLLHEVTPWLGPGERIVLRTDIIFERCGVQPSVFPEKNVSARDESESSHLKEKILRDPFYRTLYHTVGSQSEVIRAGFFNDGSTLKQNHRFSPHWLITPLHKIISRLNAANQQQELFVLVTTGAFAPAHGGHLAMMEQAKSLLEKRGAMVLGGYLTPCHQSYIKNKYGSDILTTGERLHFCEQATQTSSWLMVNNWEALCNAHTVNFTEVVEHLSQYLSTHIHTHRPIHVAYVFGSDNAGFSLAFIRRGFGICIPRAGHEQACDDIASHPLIHHNKRIIIGKPPAITPDISARHLQHSIARPHLPPVNMYLRDEGDWLLEPWHAKCNLATLQQAKNIFLQKLIDTFYLAFKKGNQELHVEVLHVAEQCKEIAEKYKDKTIISLDACIPGNIDIGISRYFNLANSDKLTGFIARPGFVDLAQQFNRIPAGNYLLLDDDIATGSTIDFVKRSLPPSCHITQVATVCNLAAPELSHMINDICDVRDFLVGSRAGGLIIQLPNGHYARAPYMLPYVQLHARAKLPLGQDVEFSYRLWELNRLFFKSLPQKLFIKDTDPAFRPLAYWIGFDDNTSLEEFCQWHVEKLCEVNLDTHLERASENFRDHWKWETPNLSDLTAFQFRSI